MDEMAPFPVMTGEKGLRWGAEVPERMLEWVLRAVNPRAVVQSAVRLKGGTSSTMHAITLEADGGTNDYVLRQFDNESWLAEEPDAAVHEADSLLWAHAAGLPAPKLIACDPAGESCGTPVTLMTRLEGTVWLLPEDRQAWLQGLAEAAARIHRIPSEGFPWPYYPYQEAGAMPRQEWSSCPDAWEAAFDVVRHTPRPAAKKCFLHRDFHPGNVLWVDGRVSGIVDWPSACVGPAGADVGHCRLDLAELFGVETADAFLDAYQGHAGSSFRYDPYWDIQALIDVLYGPPEVYPGWAAFGVSGLTDELKGKRWDDYVQSILARMK